MAEDKRRGEKFVHPDKAPLAARIVVAAGGLLIVAAAVSYLMSGADHSDGGGSVATAKLGAPATNAERRSGGATEPTALLPPTRRFTEYPEGHRHRAAQDALNSGDVTQALVLFGGRNSIETPDGPRERRMLAAIQKASDEQIGRDPAAEFSELIETYWLPEVRAISSSEPITNADMQRLVGRFEEFGRILEDNSRLRLTSAQANMRRRFVSELAAKQRQVFPRMRKLYADGLRRVLWRGDVETKLEGDRSTTLRFISAHFTRNASIQELYASVLPGLGKFRFKKAEFRWREGAEGYSYPVAAPGDAAIGYWDASAIKFTSTA